LSNAMAYCGGIELRCAVNKDADLQGKKKSLEKVNGYYPG